MKKTSILITTCVIALSLSACGKSSEKLTIDQDALAKYNDAIASYAELSSHNIAYSSNTTDEMDNEVIRTFETASILVKDYGTENMIYSIDSQAGTASEMFDSQTYYTDGNLYSSSDSLKYYYPLSSDEAISTLTGIYMYEVFPSKDDLSSLVSSEDGNNIKYSYKVASDKAVSFFLNISGVDETELSDYGIEYEFDNFSGSIIVDSDGNIISNSINLAYSVKSNDLNYKTTTSIISTFNDVGSDVVIEFPDFSGYETF